MTELDMLYARDYQRPLLSVRNRFWLLLAGAALLLGDVWLLWELVVLTRGA